jgi:hypothetical protein
LTTDTASPNAAKLPRYLQLVLGVVAASTGAVLDLGPDEYIALAVMVGGVYQAISRHVTHRVADLSGVPDPRNWFGIATNWGVMVNALMGVAVMLGAMPEVIEMPVWFEAVSELGAFHVTQLAAAGYSADRMVAAQGRLKDPVAREALRGVAAWRKL